MSIEVFAIPALSDNYIWVLRDHSHHRTFVIDPAESRSVNMFLKERQWNLDIILNTHHHPDHTGGNLELQREWKCPIYGFDKDSHRLPGLNHKVKADEILDWSGLKAKVLFLPGHTLGHIAYHFFDENILFLGDVLFGMGCGRLFEGTPEQMYHSLQTLALLPHQTVIYCAHEYTLTNARFAEPFMRHRPRFQKRFNQVETLRQNRQRTVPFLLEEELETNPFLNVKDPVLRSQLGKTNATDLEVFTELRSRRNSF